EVGLGFDRRLDRSHRPCALGRRASAPVRRRYRSLAHRWRNASEDLRGDGHRQSRRLHHRRRRRIGCSSRPRHYSGRRCPFLRPGSDHALARSRTAPPLRKGRRRDRRPLRLAGDRGALQRSLAVGSGKEISCDTCDSGALNGKESLREKEEFVAIGDNGNTAPAEVSGRRISFRASDPTKSAFFWLSGFFVVYCARPEDWIPGLKFFPLAKITAILAMWGLFTALGRTKRTLKDLPKEARLLLIMIGLLYLGAFLSPVWRGGAVTRTIDFSKIYVAWVLVFLLITTFDRLRRIIFIQAFSVVVACAATLIKGHSTPRLDGVLGGIY